MSAPCRWCGEPSSLGPRVERTKEIGSYTADICRDCGGAWLKKQAMSGFPAGLGHSIARFVALETQ